MSQHLIYCSKCETKHLVDVLRMAGQPTALVSQCGYENTNSSVINILIAGHENLSKINWQPIATAPTNGTAILGYWDSLQHQASIAWYPQMGWCTTDDRSPVPTTTPSHWSPITITSHE